MTAGASGVCRWGVRLFAIAYAGALAIYAIGTLGLFGQPRDPLSAVFLIPLGWPWNRTVDLAPEPLWPWLAAAAPLLNLLALAALCRLGRRRPPATLASALLAVGATLFGACGGSIWNAGDLAAWVRERAIEEGCEPGSIELEEWYRAEPAGNVWHGRCRSRETGAEQTFAIGVDAVWKPSSSAPQAAKP